MDASATLRQNTADKVREYAGCGPKAMCSRAGILALTVLGILTTAASGSMAAVLGGVGLNIAASALFECLQKMQQKRAGGMTLEEALAEVQSLSEQEQQELQRVAERVDLLPTLFEEALRHQRHDLTADLSGLLTTWGGTLPFAQLQAALDRLASQAAPLAEMQAEHAALQQQLTALRDQLNDDLAGQVGPMAAELHALSSRMDALVARLAAADVPPLAPPVSRRTRRDRDSVTTGLVDSVWDELRSELGRKDA